MRRLRGRVLWWGAALAVAAAIVFALRPGATPVDFATVTRGPLQVTIDEEGETRVRYRYVVSAPVPGRVLRIDLEPGDPVQASDTVVATFEPADPVPLDARARAELEAQAAAAEAALGRARTEGERARTELTFAEEELERYTQLAENGIVPRERLDQAQLRAGLARDGVAAAEFAASTAQHELEVARASLLVGGTDTRGTSLTLRSPIDGVVLRRLRESEAVVPAGETLLELGNLDTLEIVSDMLSTDAVRVEPGQPVIIDRWGGGAPMQGTVRRVEPGGFTKISALGVEEQRVNVIVDFDDRKDAASKLGDGYRVEVRVIVWQADDTLKVPISSLFRHEGSWAVFTVEEGRAVVTPIQIGERSDLEAQVLGGVADGERIIEYPGDTIDPGTMVEERRVEGS